MSIRRVLSFAFSEGTGVPLESSEVSTAIRREMEVRRIFECRPYDSEVSRALRCGLQATGVAVHNGTPLIEPEVPAKRPSLESSAEIMVLGRGLIKAAERMLPTELLDVAKGWQGLCADDQGKALARLLGVGVGPKVEREPSGLPTWLQDYMAQRAENVLPATWSTPEKETEFWPNCVGRATIALAFARLAGAPHFAFITHNTGHQIWVPRFERVLRLYVRSCQRRGKEVEPSVLNIQAQFEEFGRTIASRVDWLHLGALIQVRDGTWIVVDPAAESLCRACDQNATKQAITALEQFNFVLPGLTKVVDSSAKYLEQWKEVERETVSLLRQSAKISRFLREQCNDSLDFAAEVAPWAFEAIDSFFAEFGFPEPYRQVFDAVGANRSDTDIAASLIIAMLDAGDVEKGLADTVRFQIDDGPWMGLAVLQEPSRERWLTLDDGDASMGNLFTPASQLKAYARLCEASGREIGRQIRVGDKRFPLPTTTMMAWVLFDVFCGGFVSRKINSEETLAPLDPELIFKQMELAFSNVREVVALRDLKNAHKDSGRPVPCMEIGDASHLVATAVLSHVAWCQDESEPVEGELAKHSFDQFRLGLAASAPLRHNSSTTSEDERSALSTLQALPFIIRYNQVVLERLER